MSSDFGSKIDLIATLNHLLDALIMCQHKSTYVKISIIQNNLPTWSATLLKNLR